MRNNVTQSKKIHQQTITNQTLQVTKLVNSKISLFLTSKSLCNVNKLWLNCSNVMPCLKIWPIREKTTANWLVEVKTELTQSKDLHFQKKGSWTLQNYKRLYRKLTVKSSVEKKTLNNYSLKWPANSNQSVQELLLM